MERRSAFRLRLPWSQPSPAPAPTPAKRRSTKPNTKTSPSPSTTPSSSLITEPTRNQPPSTTTTTTSTKPSSPAGSLAGTQARNEAPTSTTTTIPISPMPLPKPSAETKAPSQPSTTSRSLSHETPATPPQPLDESKAPIQPSTTNSTPAIAPASPKFETRTPTAPITDTPTSTIAKNPPSTPPVVAPSTPSQTLASRTESQPLTPSLEQHGITSQPASPSDVATKSSVSQPPLPSRSTPQTREMTPTSSPTRKGHEVLSTDQLTSKSPRPASQNSNLPSGLTSQMQPKDQTTSQPRSPPKELQESSESSSKSTKTLPSYLGKEPKPTAIQPHSEQLEHIKKETISDTGPEAKVRSPEKVTRPSELSEVKSTRGITEGPSQISDSSGIINEPKTVRQPDTNIKATRDVKEVVEETRDKNYGAGEQIGGFLTSKEQPSIVFQSKKAYVEKRISSDDDRIRANPDSDEKTTRAVSSQPKNKTVVSDPSQKTAVSAEPDIPLHDEIKDNISNLVHRMVAGNGKHNLEERPVNVITLAGDNRGASMQLRSDSSSKEGAIHIHRGYKLNPDESAYATTDAEGNSEGRQPKDARTMEDQEAEAYLNCNVQGLNNSIIFDSSIAVKSPGIYMSFPRTTFARTTSEPLNSSGNTGALEAHKAEFSVTPAQKLTYEPTIRRRCLSDSDPDNPEKPQRHVCPVGCMGKSKENEIDIL